MVNRLQNLILFVWLACVQQYFLQCSHANMPLPIRVRWITNQARMMQCFQKMCIYPLRSSVVRILPRRPGTRLGTALKPPPVWWCSSMDAEVCSYRQRGSASASFSSPMVFLVLEENVHSLRDVTLLSRQWNINCDANWKWTAFYVLWNEAICNPRIGYKSIWEFNQEFNVAVRRQKCYQTLREFEYSGMSKAFAWFGGK